MVNSITDYEFSDSLPDCFEFDYDISEIDMIPCRFCGDLSLSGICGACNIDPDFIEENDDD